MEEKRELAMKFKRNFRFLEIELLTGGSVKEVILSSHRFG